MMILFSPSEGKRHGGVLPPINPSSFIFSELYTKRCEIIDTYQKVIQEGDLPTLQTLFGIKDTRLFEHYTTPLQSALTLKAIERYDGVAYEYLDYPTLSSKAQGYIDEQVIIFSNLFGAVLASDSLPEYKLKQGSTIAGLAPEKFYKEHFSEALDTMIGDQEILDLRAGFYDKFYTPKHHVTTLTFLKGGKVVSHWAKAYRGVVLRTVAQHTISSLASFIALPIEGLALAAIKEGKKKREIIYEIV